MGTLTDDSGKRFTSELSEKLNELGVEYIFGAFYDEDHHYKDPNEALIKDRFYLKEKLAEYVYKESDVATQAKDFLFGLSIIICLQLIE